ncbi:SGNH/GDSL hydrolase family protein [Bacteroidota bacterium]
MLWKKKIAAMIKFVRILTYFFILTVLSFSCKQEEISILSLGDSYTIGESVSENERWPLQLAGQMRLNGIEVLQPQIIAATGWTTNELLAGMDTATLKERYDLVTVLIGVNNQYRGRDTVNYHLELENILKRAIRLAGGENSHVVVLSIPDWGVTPFASGRDISKIASEIDAYNRVKKEISKSLGLHYIDITDISRKAETMNYLLASDGLHPSGLMYAEWVDRLLPVALDVFR